MRTNDENPSKFSGVMISRNSMVLAALLAVSQIISAADIERAASPSGGFRLFESSLKEAPFRKGFYIRDTKGGKSIGTLYEEGETGAPAVTGMTARWSGDERVLIVKIEFLKTCRIAAFQRDLKNQFHEVACGIPETSMLADIDIQKFGAKAGDGSRIDSAGGEIGEWRDDGKIPIRQELVLTDQQGDMKTYTISYSLRQSKGKLELVDWKKQAKVQ